MNLFRRWEVVIRVLGTDVQRTMFALTRKSAERYADEMLPLMITRYGLLIDTEVRRAR